MGVCYRLASVVSLHHSLAGAGRVRVLILEQVHCQCSSTQLGAVKLLMEKQFYDMNILNSWGIYLFIVFFISFPPLKSKGPAKL